MRATGEVALLFGKAKRPQRRGCSPYGCRTVEYVEEQDPNEMIVWPMATPMATATTQKHPF